MITRWVVGVVLLFGILLLMLPKTDEESLARIASAAMLMCTQDFREQVARQVLEDAAVNVAFINTCPDLIAALEVDGQGEIVISGKEHALEMRLLPVVEAGRVRWSCQGEPVASVARLCKP